MTREEAIAELKYSIEMVYFDPLTGETSEWLNEDNQRYVDACNMAIKALEQESCEDAISRKAAIDVMIKIEQDDIDRYGCKIPEGFDSSPAIEALDNLPSITSQPKTGHWIDDCGGVKCSRCGYCIDDYYYAKTYCTNCGCRMESEETP